MSRSRKRPKGGGSPTVRSSATSLGDSCPKCGTSVSEIERYCTTCRYDLGAPNVRESGSPVERHALKERASEARERARSDKRLPEFKNFSEALKRYSGVVVTLPAAVARNLVFDPRAIYTGYEVPVEAGVRRPASLDHDRHRRAVGGLLFGSYDGKIRYGALSLTHSGLPTYGEICCHLRSVAIQDRTSFLESNSYTFVEEHSLRPGMPIPPGYRAVWDNRHELALAKLGGLLGKAQGIAAWQDLLVSSDGKDRNKDDFIEAHIYDSFDIGAIDGMCRVSRKRLSKESSIDAKLALERFSKRATAGGQSK